MFGQNAGKIWVVLSEKGPLLKDNIQQFTKLNDEDFYAGVGWLARENKIMLDEKDQYKLSNTNLTKKIGSSAGRIWKILDIWDEADITTMKRLAGVEESSVHLALGWLAREDKICLDEKEKFILK
jgi:hypothetical protein